MTGRYCQVLWADPLGIHTEHSCSEPFASAHIHKCNCGSTYTPTQHVEECLTSELAYDLTGWVKERLAQVYDSSEIGEIITQINRVAYMMEQLRRDEADRKARFLKEASDLVDTFRTAIEVTGQAVHQARSEIEVGLAAALDEADRQRKARTAMPEDCSDGID